MGKVTVGRLRPHFIPSCFNKFSYKDFCQDPNDWYTNYTCLGEISDVVKEKDGAYDIRYDEKNQMTLIISLNVSVSSQSFPSGHASTAFCGLIFLAVSFLRYVFLSKSFFIISSSIFTKFGIIVTSVYFHMLWKCSVLL